MYMILCSNCCQLRFLQSEIRQKSSYLTTFACQFGRYIYDKLALGTTPAGDMFQQKLDKIIKDVPIVCGIADNILIVIYDKSSHDLDTIEI